VRFRCSLPVSSWSYRRFRQLHDQEWATGRDGRGFAVGRERVDRVEKQAMKCEATSRAELERWITVTAPVLLSPRIPNRRACGLSHVVRERRSRRVSRSSGLSPIASCARMSCEPEHALSIGRCSRTSSTNRAVKSHMRRPMQLGQKSRRRQPRRRPCSNRRRGTLARTESCARIPQRRNASSLGYDEHGQRRWMGYELERCHRGFVLSRLR
jgi:hypothetical protein